MHENVSVSVKIDAPVEKVWNAITDKESLRKWYFDIPDFEAKEGYNFSFYAADEGKDKYHHFCEILEVIPEQKLKHSWEYPEISKDKTLVKWELQPEENGTLVTLTHKGLENFHHLGGDFHRESFENGWKEILGKSLKNFVEN